MNPFTAREERSRWGTLAGSTSTSRLLSALVKGERDIATGPGFTLEDVMAEIDAIIADPERGHEDS